MVFKTCYCCLEEVDLLVSRAISAKGFRFGPGVLVSGATLTTAVDDIPEDRKAAKATVRCSVLPPSL